MAKKMDRKGKSIMREARKRGIKFSLDKTGKLESIELKESTFFLPDDWKKFKGTGSWVLYVKKGLLYRLEKKGKKK